MGLFKGRQKKNKDIEDAGDKKISKKKLLVILILIILIVCAAGGAGIYFFLSGRSPEFYWDEKEKVASVTEIVGKRRCKTEETKKAVTYTYTSGKSDKKDVQKYVKYLTKKKGFADIEIPDFEKLAKEDGKEGEQTKSKEKKKHFELGADSKKDGKFLKAVINIKEDSYTIKVQTKKGTLAEQLEKIEAARAEQEGAHDFIEAVEAVQGLTPEKLGVSASPDQLEYVPGPGRMKVDGENYYKVMVYTKGPGGANNYQGSYLVDCMFVNDFYEYNEETGEYKPLEEKSIGAKAGKE